MSTNEAAVEASLALSIDPSRDLVMGACGCGAEGHRALTAWLVRQNPAPGATAEPLWNSDAILTPKRSTHTLATLRANGAAYVLVGAEGGWARGWWMLEPTPAGVRHAAEITGSSDRHVGPGGCGGEWNADARCARCGALESLTIARAVGRIAGLPAGEAAERERWASQFVCPTHGRARYATVRTDKCCTLCGALLLRRTPVA